MQEKRNHHFLPRFYLKGFASELDNSHIWEYQRRRVYVPGMNNRSKYNPVLISLRKAGAAFGEYAYSRPDGTLDFNTYEDALEQLEKPADIVFDKIRALQSIDSSDREIFAASMATYRRNGMPRQMELKTIVESPMPRVVKAMLSMRWQFLIAPDGHNFVTSDNPVHTFKGELASVSHIRN